MKIYPFNKIICIDRESTIPFYLQIAHCIMKAIKVGKLQNDDVLPSVNELSSRLEVSRDTAEKGYKYLKSIGVLGAVAGKGYFVTGREPGNQVKVLLLFNQLSSYKKIIYDSFVNLMGDTAAIDFHVYNNDFCRFKKILQERNKDYDYYIILPDFKNDAGDLSQVINALPKEKLIVVGKRIKELKGNYSGVYENLENDIFQALEKAVQPLRKYHTISLVFPEACHQHSAIMMGLRRFCSQYGFHSQVITDMAREDVGKGIAYITLREDDLVTLVERIMALSLEAGKDVGVLSYNETLLKRIILNGITTISTDFKMMGEQIARLILNRSVEQTETRSFLTLRNSL